MIHEFTLRNDLFLLKHPFYQAWIEGRLELSTLQDYVGQYFHHVEAFPGYLQNALEHCEDEVFGSILAENLAEEDGTTHGTSHPELWLRFAEGIGVPRQEMKTVVPREGIANVVETFTRFSTSSLPEALGSLYAYESQVPEIAESKIKGLVEHFHITDERTLAFFEIHKTADIEHRESLMSLISRLPEDDRLMAQMAADSACAALWDFLTDVYQTQN